MMGVGRWVSLPATDALYTIASRSISIPSSLVRAKALQKARNYRYHGKAVSRSAGRSFIMRRRGRMASSSRGDLFARVIGFLVFLLGLGVILWVLTLAFRMFHDPNLGVVRGAASGSSGPTAAEIGIGFGQIVLRIVLLFLASICGSLIANKGINLYFTALHGPRPSPAPPVPAPQLEKPPPE
jgi:hypothetical protein